METLHASKSKRVANFVVIPMSLSASRTSLPLWLLALSLLAAIAYLPLLDYLPLYLEEPRRALIAAHMLDTGDYLVPMHAGQVYLAKPPLFNWLICVVSLPFGAVEAWSARLPSVLALWCLVLFLVSSTWRRLGKNGALLLGCALLLNPEFLLKGQLAEIDLVFACLVTAALWSWFLLDQRNQGGLWTWLPSLLLMALAYLTKREPAVLFFYLTVGPYLLLQRRGRELLALGHWLAIFLIALPLILWLAVLAARTGGWDALWQSLLHEVLLRGGGGGHDGYLAHLLTYPLQILGACAPFSLLSLPLLDPGVRRAVQARHGDLVHFAMVAVLANLPVYWFKGELAVRYFLPMFPFLLLLAAACYATLLAEPQVLRARWERYFASAAHMLFWILAIAALLFATTLLLPSYRPSIELPLPWPIPIGGALVVLGGLWQLQTLRKTSPIQIVFPMMVVLMLLLRGIEFNFYMPLKAQSLAHTQNAHAIIADLVQRLRANKTLFVSSRIHSAIWFYAPQGLLHPLTEGTEPENGDLLLLHNDLRPEFQRRFASAFHEITRYRYENDDLRLEVIQRSEGM